MTLTDCQLLSIVAQLGTFAAAAERLHITPSAVSHAVSGVEAECGFPLFTRTKSGVTLTAAAEKLMPAIQQMLASSESLDQSIAQINGMHKGALRLGVFNSACVTWLPKIVPGFRAAFPGIDVQIYQGSYDDITGWLKTGAVELGFLSNSSAHDLDFEPLYDDRLICIAPPDYQPRRPGVVRAEELRSQPFVSQQSDVDADIQSYFKKNDLHVSSRCYIVDDQSMTQCRLAAGTGADARADVQGGRGQRGVPGAAIRARRQAHDWSGVPVADSALPRRPGICGARAGVCKEAVTHAVGAGHARPAGLRYCPRFLTAVNGARRPEAGRLQFTDSKPFRLLEQFLLQNIV